MPRRTQRPLTRRTVLKAGAAGFAGLVGTAVVGACGSSTGGEGTVGPQLVPLFNPNRVIAAGIPQRLPFGLVDNGIALTDDGEAIAVRILLDGELVDTTTAVGRVVAHDHPEGTEEHEHSGLLRYYAVRSTLPTTGVYDIEFDISGVTARAPVQAFDPAEVSVLLVGDAFPSFESPTTEDLLDVDVLCTQPNGPCQFHTGTVASMLAAGQPMAVLVATPAFCSTAYCGPVLDTLIEAAPGAPHVAMVHLEPYANARAVDGDLGSPDLRLAASMATLGLDYEPVLFLVDSAGTVADRIDNVFDLSELEPALASLG